MTVKRLAAMALLLMLASAALAQTVTTRKHFRELSVPLVDVLTALGIPGESLNNPSFKIEGRNLIIIVEGAGS
jgi:hypothetical protein